MSERSEKPRKVLFIGEDLNSIVILEELVKQADHGIAAIQAKSVQDGLGLLKGLPCRLVLCQAPDDMAMIDLLERFPGEVKTIFFAQSPSTKLIRQTNAPAFNGSALLDVAPTNKELPVQVRQILLELGYI